MNTQITTNIQKKGTYVTFEKYSALSIFCATLSWQFSVTHYLDVISFFLRIAMESESEE